MPLSSVELAIIGQNGLEMLDKEDFKPGLPCLWLKGAKIRYNRCPLTYKWRRLMDGQNTLQNNQEGYDTWTMVKSCEPRIQKALANKNQIIRYSLPWDEHIHAHK